MNHRFLPAQLYSAPAIATRERVFYAARLWHPLAASSELPDGSALPVQLLEQPLLLTRRGTELHAFHNRCPHRGVPLLPPARPGEPIRATVCRRLICPYHGWTYDLRGQLRAAAREADFLEPFDRSAWPLEGLPCREWAGLIWVAGGPDPIPLEHQIDLLLQESAEALAEPRILLGRRSSPLHCNWKIAHDNTLDDYHVAIAHPTTLHREQGPVRHYRHDLSDHASLLATPWAGCGEFLTFGFAPWSHLLLWPDGRLALIQFPPVALDRCRMEVWLLAAQRWLDAKDCSDAAGQNAASEAWMAELQLFLEEDRDLVEGAQLGYAAGLRPGPAHRLELRILQQQSLYARLMQLQPADLSG